VLQKSPPGIFAAPALKDTRGSIEDDHRKSPAWYSLTPLSCIIQNLSSPIILVGWIMIGSSRSARALLAQLEQKMLLATTLAGKKCYV